MLFSPQNVKNEPNKSHKQYIYKTEQKDFIFYLFLFPCFHTWKYYSKYLLYAPKRSPRFVNVLDLMLIEYTHQIRTEGARSNRQSLILHLFRKYTFTSEPLSIKPSNPVFRKTWQRTGGFNILQLLALKQGKRTKNYFYTCCRNFYERP